jgi:hypothetical protein
MNKNYPKNQIQYRDSVLIDYTLRYCFNSKNNVPKTTNWRYLEKDSSEINHPYFAYFIGNIYYSPDSLKALAFYAYSTPEYTHGDNKPPIKNYYGAAFALIRDSLNHPWQCYRLDYIAASGWDTKEEIWDVLEGYYHSRIRQQEDLVLNPNVNYYEFIDKIGMYIDSSGKVRYKPNLTRNETVILSNKYYDDSIHATFINKYTLDDPEFWTESIVWKKGLRVPWLYDFQTESHIITDDQIIEYNIPYPDSIIQMYKRK